MINMLKVGGGGDEGVTAGRRRWGGGQGWGEGSDITHLHPRWRRRRRGRGGGGDTDRKRRRVSVMKSQCEKLPAEENSPEGGPSEPACHHLDPCGPRG